MSTAAAAPIVGGAAIYGSEVQNQLSAAATEAKAELDSAVATHRQELSAELEAQLTRLRAEGQQVMQQLVQAADELRATGRAMIERVEAVSFEARDELNRFSARLKGEGDERLDVLEDHLRGALERVRVEVETATSDAVARIRAVAESEAALAQQRDVPVAAERVAGDPLFYLAPEQADDDDIDLG